MKNTRLTQFAISDLIDAPEASVEEGDAIIINFAKRTLTTASLIAERLGLSVEWEAYENDGERGIKLRIQAPSGSVEVRPIEVAEAIPRDPRCFSAVRRDQDGEGERAVNRFVVEHVLAPLREAGVDVATIDHAAVGQDVIAFEPRSTVKEIGRKTVESKPLTPAEWAEAKEAISQSLQTLVCLAAAASGFSADAEVSGETLAEGAAQLWYMACTKVENGRDVLDRRALGPDVRYARYRLQGALARMAEQRTDRDGLSLLNVHALAAELMRDIVVTPSEN